MLHFCNDLAILCPNQGHHTFHCQRYVLRLSPGSLREVSSLLDMALILLVESPLHRQ